MLGINQLIGFGVLNVPYVANSVRFDGSNDYLSRGAGLSGASDSDKGIFSVWVDFKGGDSTLQYFVVNDGEFFTIRRNASNIFEFLLWNAARGSLTCQFSTTGTITSSSGWTHILGAWDLSTNTTQLYINDSSDHTQTTATSGNLDYTWSDAWIGSRASAGTPYINAEISDLYLNLGEYVDISSSANRRKFIDASGKPVDLGSDGSTPTGTAPIIFLSGETASWHTNKGSGGGFTENGALTDGSSSPSD